MVIAVDFDGTIVEHRYPAIGKERPFAVDALRQLSAEGHKIILWTVRSGATLDDALEWCSSRGLSFYAVNSNYPSGSLFADKKDFSPKVEADLYIDDRNLGGLPDWGEIYSQISEKALSRKQRHTRHRSFSKWMKKLFR